jgi:hypothetical protein
MIFFSCFLNYIIGNFTCRLTKYIHWFPRISKVDVYWAMSSLIDDEQKLYILIWFMILLEVDPFYNVTGVLIHGFCFF